MLCPHSGSEGRRSAATTAAPAAPPPAERALLSGPRAREDRSRAEDGVVAKSGRRAEPARLSWLQSLCFSAGETPRLPPARPPTVPVTVASRSGASGGSWVALAEEAWRARPHSARGEAAAGARSPALCKRGWSEIHASRGRWSPLGSLAHLITRSGADKGHLGAEATAARGSTASRLAPDSCSASAAGRASGHLAVSSGAQPTGWQCP